MVEGGAPAAPALPLIRNSLPLLHTSAQCSAGSKRKCDPVYGRLDWEYKEESDLGSLGVARALGGFSIR